MFLYNHNTHNYAASILLFESDICCSVALSVPSQVKTLSAHYLCDPYNNPEDVIILPTFT